MDTKTVLSRFPLVPRPRPPCSPLSTRAIRISDLAATAARDQDLAAASAVFNQAALLASDCGSADQARQWCRQHAEAYLRACPLDARSGRLALEPLVNLARLHIRDGNGAAAYALLDTLYQAVCHETPVVIDGIAIPVPELTYTSGDLDSVRRWLWTVHLADSPRALISAGRWHDALAHLEHHHGIGQRMLDGRQVAVIARYLTGDAQGALTIVKDTVTTEPWEELVSGCLTALCAPGHSASMRWPRTVLGAYLNPTAASAAELLVFTTRLGLTVIDACGGTAHSHSRAVAHDLITRVIRLRDGYATRELLAHQDCRALLTAEEEDALLSVAGLCALGHGNIPGQVQDQLTAALSVAGENISQHIGSPWTPPQRSSQVAAPACSANSPQN
jgi:hypothetical protein